MKFTAQRPRLTKRLSPNRRTIECFPLPMPDRPISKGLRALVLLPSASCLGVKKTVQAKQRQKIVFEEAENDLEPDMAEVLE